MTKKSLNTIETSGIYGIIDRLIVLAISGLSFYLGSKMFPNYGLLEPKKDSTGNILLE
ncbi:MAG: hypothetical protein M0Q90_12650 [Bacteroidales bacterium]|nr:hypothetical protein [Bacteroidales bacterium]